MRISCIRKLRESECTNLTGFEKKTKDCLRDENKYEI